MNKLAFVAALAAPAAAFAQSAPAQAPTTLTVQPVYSAPTTAPLTVDPSGATAVPQGAGPNPYLPSAGGGGPTYLPATSPGGPPEGQVHVEGMYLGGSAPSERGERGERFEGAVPGAHVVQKGDTLWDICSFYFHDPWRWPEVWGLNPQITNPHWIYPGNVVRIRTGGGEAPTAAAATPASEPASPVPPGVEALLRQIAFVGLADLRAAGTISGSTDEKLMLASGDDVFISYPEGKPPQVNARYSIYVPDRDIVEPGTKQVIGKYVVIRGEVQITEVKKGKEARAVITDITNQGVVERDQKVGPLKTQLRSMAEVAPEANVEGLIAGVLQQTEIIGLAQVVFIDRGRADGLRPGNRMVVVRRGDAYPSYGALTEAKDDHRYPDTDYGSVFILDVGDKTAVAWTSRTDTDLQVGDHVVMRKTK